MKAQWIEVERFDENFIFQSFEIQNLTAALFKLRGLKVYS